MRRSLSESIMGQLGARARDAGTHTGTRHNGEQITGAIWTVPSIALGPATKRDVVVGRFAPQNADGMLSMDFFRDQPFTLDVARGTLTLETTSSTERIASRAAAIPMRLKPNGPTSWTSSFAYASATASRPRRSSTPVPATSPKLGYSGIWLRDESALVTVGRMLGPETNLDLAIVRNGGRGPIEPIVATRFTEQFPALSPDEQWLAYTSNQSGRDQVYLRRLAGDDEQIQVSVGGGTEAVWTQNGRELIYRSPTSAEGRTEPTMIAATIATKPKLAVTSRTELFPAASIVTANPHANYDVSADGNRFLFVRSNPSTRIMVIQNLAGMVARRRAGGRGTP